MANLSATDAPTDITAMDERGGIASARAEFEFHTMLDSGLLTHDEADALRPRVYEMLAEDTGRADAETRLVKVHDAYLTTPVGEPLLRAARGAIVIVRDPRDVACSLANHRHSTVDEAIAFMADRDACFAASLRTQPAQLRRARLLD